MRELIRPQLPGGFRDYSASEMLARLEMLEKIRRVYERFGFDPLATPGVERLETLASEDSAGIIYELARLRGTRPLPRSEDSQRIALRFDLTVPLARYFAANVDVLPKPFKRWQLGNVHRGEKPQAGRYCEFAQCDIDTVGSSSPLADAEIICVMYATLTELGVTRFMIRVNNRKILNGLPALAGFTEELIVDVLRLLDKTDKIGIDAVIHELTRPPKPLYKREELFAIPEEPTGHSDMPTDSGYGLGLGEAAGNAIRQFINIRGSVQEVLDQLRSTARGNALISEGANELQQIAEYLTASGVPPEAWCIDLGVARGLGYYTGPVFETTLLDLPSFGSIFSGGRYDGLVARFMSDPVPATGSSIGVDRLFAALKELECVRMRTTATQVLVSIMDPGHVTDYLGIAAELRSARINTSLYLGEDRAFKAQLAFAARQCIPVVVICGGNEFAASAVTIKDMGARKQVTVPRKDLTLTVRNILDARTET